jgi:hypothetical protein
MKKTDIPRNVALPLMTFLEGGLWTLANWNATSTPPTPEQTHHVLENWASWAAQQVRDSSVRSWTPAELAAALGGLAEQVRKDLLNLGNRNMRRLIERMDLLNAGYAAYLDLEEGKK